MASDIEVRTPAECIAALEAMKDRIWPLLKATKAEYDDRVRPGYPILIDDIEVGGVFGLSLDPGFGVFFMTDGQRVFAELHRVALRTDTLSAANSEKFSGQPVQEHRDLDEMSGDLELRNLISELLNRWNNQQTAIFRVDS